MRHVTHTLESWQLGAVWKTALKCAWVIKLGLNWTTDVKQLQTCLNATFLIYHPCMLQCILDTHCSLSLLCVLCIYYQCMLFKTVLLLTTRWHTYICFRHKLHPTSTEMAFMRFINVAFNQNWCVALQCMWFYFITVAESVRKQHSKHLLV